MHGAVDARGQAPQRGQGEEEVSEVLRSKDLDRSAKVPSPDSKSSETT